MAGNRQPPRQAVGDPESWARVLTWCWAALPLQRGTYLPQTYIIQEEMVVTEHVSDKEALGSFIYHLCSGKDTYRLRRRATRRREWPSPPTLAPALSPNHGPAEPGPGAGDQLSESWDCSSSNDSSC